MKDAKLLPKTWEVDSGTIASNGKLATYIRWLGYIGVVGMGGWGFWLVLELPYMASPLLIWITVLLIAIALYEKVSRPSMTRQIAYKLKEDRLTLTAKPNVPENWLLRLFRGLSALSIVFSIIILIFGFLFDPLATLVAVIACPFIIWQSHKLFNPDHWHHIERTFDFKPVKTSNSRVWLKSNLDSMQVHLFSTLSWHQMTLCFNSEQELKLVRQFLLEQYPEMNSVDEKHLFKWVL
ncbi:hypothetical protein [Vibrio sp. TRT 17S01]|uniref:hypothetical protein n=1 Tax=Vibrio sp. TRT 17S01 TaxID=3418505 RepID=UPI003CED87D3